MAKGRIPQTLIVWGGTVAVALGILAAAFTLAHRAPAPDQAAGIDAPAPAAENAPPAPVPVPRKTETAALPSSSSTPAAKAAPVEPPPPPPSDSALVPLELHHLAGTLKTWLPDTPRGATFPLAHTCYRSNESPALEWSGVPANARSMVVVMERRQDGKPPAWMWAIFNLAPGSGKIPANIPKIAQLKGGARQARNLYGKPYYTGPCEPHGEVPYAMRLFALDVPLAVDAGASRNDLVRGMNGHIVDAADYGFVHKFRN